MSGARVLVAGASGQVGRRVTAELVRRGIHVRALVRAPRAGGLAGVEVHVGDALADDGLRGACDGIDVVFSSLGASVQPTRTGGRASFPDVDWPVNRRLIDAAKAAGARRFVYVSAFGAQASRHLAYMDAHERVVDHLRASGLEFAILRPTGLFSAFASFLDLARQGRVPVIGAGTSRTNPLDDRDLALACADAVEGRGPAERDLGGPEVLERAQIARLACEALGSPPRLMRAPAWVMRATALAARPFAPRVADVFAFVTHVSTHECVAPAFGSRTLDAYFREAVAAAAAPVAEQA